MILSRIRESLHEKVHLSVRTTLSREQSILVHGVRKPLSYVSSGERADYQIHT